MLPLVTRWETHTKDHRKVKFLKNVLTQKPLLEASLWSLELQNKHFPICCKTIFFSILLRNQVIQKNLFAGLILSKPLTNLTAQGAEQNIYSNSFSIKLNYDVKHSLQ